MNASYTHTSTHGGRPAGMHTRSPGPRGRTHAHMHASPLRPVPPGLMMALQPHLVFRRASQRRPQHRQPSPSPRTTINLSPARWSSFAVSTAICPVLPSCFRHRQGQARPHSPILGRIRSRYCEYCWKKRLQQSLQRFNTCSASLLACALLSSFSPAPTDGTDVPKGGGKREATLYTGAVASVFVVLLFCERPVSL